MLERAPVKMAKIEYRICNVPEFYGWAQYFKGARLKLVPRAKYSTVTNMDGDELTEAQVKALKEIGISTDVITPVFCSVSDREIKRYREHGIARTNPLEGIEDDGRFYRDHCVIDVEPLSAIADPTKFWMTNDRLPSFSIATDKVKFGSNPRRQITPLQVRTNQRLSQIELFLKFCSREREFSLEEVRPIYIGEVR